MAGDEEIAERLRHHRNKTILVVNKIDSESAAIASSEFYSLGFNQMYSISAASRRGIETMMEEVLKPLQVVEEQPKPEQGLVITIIGKPNVGKSTLVNRILGEERVIVFDQPGTTRDSIFIPFSVVAKNTLWSIQRG